MLDGATEIIKNTPLLPYLEAHNRLSQCLASVLTLFTLSHLKAESRGMVFVLWIKETELQRDLILAQQVNRKSVIEGRSESPCFIKGFHTKSSEALKYKFKLLKKIIPLNWHLEYILTRVIVSTVEAEAAKGGLKQLEMLRGKAMYNERLTHFLEFQSHLQF